MMFGSSHQAMGGGQEFDIIRRLLSRWGDLAVGVGDDAAIIAPSESAFRVISTDACVEDVHFKRSWITPFEVGSRATAAALSDLAAMGASAEHLLVSLTLPELWLDVLDDIADGIAFQVRKAGAGCSIIGGNMSKGATFSLTSTVIGKAVRPIKRSGAKVGDAIVVTGELGGPRAALDAWLGGAEPTAWARSRFLSPEPRLIEGDLLANAGATAMIDISDGLLADSQHIGAASEVELAIDPALVPLGSGVDIQQALTGGEEYELLATIPSHLLDNLFSLWPSYSTIPLTVIGHVEPVRPQGAPARSSPQPDSGVFQTESHGHDHFRKGR